jgi:hypothetical protein
VLVTAMAAAAALILGLIAVTVGGGGQRTHHPNGGSGPAAVLAAYSTTVGAESAQWSASVLVGSTSVTVNGVGDVRTDQAVLTVQLPAPFGPIDVRSTGQDYFVHLPPQLQAFAGAKPWVQVDRDALQALAGSQLGVPGLGTTLDFSNVLAWLRGVSGHITPVGNERINGTPQLANPRLTHGQNETAESSGQTATCSVGDADYLFERAWLCQDL